MSGLRTFWSELNPKISSIYHNYFDNWWGKVALLSSSIIILVVFNLIPSWIQFGFLFISAIVMWSFFTSKKPTYQPTKQQFTVTTNYNNSANSYPNNNSSINHVKNGVVQLPRNRVISPFNSKFVEKRSRSNDDQDLDQSSSSSTVGDWHQNQSQREPIDPITLSAVTSPGFSSRLIQKKNSNPLRESNNDLSFSAASGGSPYHNQKSPNTFKLGQLPSPSWKPQSKLNPPSFQSPVNTGRYSATRRSKKQVPFGTTYVHVAPVDVINKSIAASKASSNPNSPGNARAGISFGMGGYPTSPTANITTRMQKLWSPPTMDAVNAYEAPARPMGSPSPNNVPLGTMDPGMNRKRNRIADMADKRSSTIIHGPGSYGQDELVKQNSKRTKYIQSSSDLRYAGVNAANRNLPFMALPNLQAHNDESMTSESILEQMNQTEKRFLPDDDTISPIRSPKKTRSSAGGTKGSSIGQSSSSPYRKRRVADQSFSNLQEEEEVQKNRGFCSCSECYYEAAGMNVKGNKIPKQSSPVNDSVSSSKKKKTVTFNQCKSTSANQSKGYISAATNDQKQSDITDKYSPVQMQIISKANYEADKQRRLERLNRMLNESFKRSEYKPKSPEAKSQSAVSNVTVPGVSLSFGGLKESSGPQINFGIGNVGSSIFSSATVRDGIDQVEGAKQVPSAVALSVIDSDVPKITLTTDENSIGKINLEKASPGLFEFGAKPAESTSSSNPPPSLFGQMSSSSLQFGQDTASPAVAASIEFGNKSDSKVSVSQQEAGKLTFGISVPAVTTSDNSSSSIPGGFSFGAPVSVASPSTLSTGIFGGVKSDPPPYTSSSVSTTTPATVAITTPLFGTASSSSNITSSNSAVTSPSSFGFGGAPATSLFGKSTPAHTTADAITPITPSGGLSSATSVPASTFAFGQTTTASAAPVTTASNPAPSFLFGGSTPSIPSTKVDTPVSQPAGSLSFGGSGITNDPNKNAPLTTTTEGKPGGFSFGQTTSTPSADSASSTPLFGQTSGSFKFGGNTSASTPPNQESVSQVTQANSDQGAPSTTISFGQSNANTTTGSTPSLFGINKDSNSSGTSLFGQPNTSALTNLFNTTTPTTAGTLPSTTAAPTTANTSSASPSIFSFGQGSSTPASGGQSLNTSTGFGQSSGSAGFGFNAGFGQKSGESATTSTPASFGQNTAAPALSFGQSTNASPGTTFGLANTSSGGTGLFGQGNTSSTAANLTFGQANPTANISFGQSNSIATGGGFGQDKASPSFSFGQTGTGTFGQSSTGMSVPSFGQGNTSTAVPTFGQSNTGSSVPTFGQGNTGTTTPTFGQSNTGTSTPTFGQTSTPSNSFGQGNTGSGSGIFSPSTTGSSTHLFGQGSSTGGNPSFGQSNTAGSTGFGKGTVAPGGSMFGQGNSPATSNVFGQSPTGATSTFGQTNQGTTPAFGQSNTGSTTFGQSSSGASGVFSFGQASNTSFGQANTSGTAFGSPASKPAFGQTSSSNNSGVSSFPSFGQSPSTPSGGFNFGAANNNTSLTATPQSSPFGGGSGGGFNAPQPQTGGSMFGSTASANPPAAGVFQFGQQQQQQPQGGFNFGQQQQQQVQPFGGAAQQQQPMFNMGTSASSARRRDARGRRYR